MEQPGSAYSYDTNGYFVRVARLDGSLQKLVQRTLQAKILYLSDYTVLVGEPGARRMYEIMRLEMYWPHMENYVYATLKDCLSCASTIGTVYNHRKNLRLLLASGRLDFVAMNVLGPLPKTECGSQFVVAMTDRLLKLSGEVSTTKTAASHRGSIFLDHCVFQYGFPQFIACENRPQFVGQFFSALCGYLGCKNVEMTAYYLQTNGHTERYNKTIIVGMRQYFA